MVTGDTMMGRLNQKLPTMLALAHERTEGSRIELAGMLADVFLTKDALLSLREEELVNELIDQLMQTNSPALRAQLVSKFADTSQMPRKIAMSIACEGIDLAGNVLKNCQTLTDKDLIQIVYGQSHDHALAIAQRDSISEAVADALVTTGDLRVMRIVAENLGAELTPRAIDVLSDAARFTAELREPVLKRPETQLSTATKLYWWVSQDLRRYALQRFSMTPGQIDQALAKMIEDLLGYHQFDKANDDVMYQVANWLAERQALSTKILAQILRMGHFRLFNIVISQLAGLDLATVDSIVTEPGGRELALLCRAIGIDKPGFVSIFLLSRGARPDDQIVHPRELSQALISFDRITTNLAHDMLRNWKQNPPHLTGGHEDLVMEA